MSYLWKMSVKMGLVHNATPKLKSQGKHKFRGCHAVCVGKRSRNWTKTSTSDASKQQINDSWSVGTHLSALFFKLAVIYSVQRMTQCFCHNSSFPMQWTILSYSNHLVHLFVPCNIQFFNSNLSIVHYWFPRIIKSTLVCWYFKQLEPILVGLGILLSFLITYFLPKCIKKLEKQSETKIAS